MLRAAVIPQAMVTTIPAVSTSEKQFIWLGSKSGKRAHICTMGVDVDNRWCGYGRFDGSLLLMRFDPCMGSYRMHKIAR